MDQRFARWFDKRRRTFKLARDGFSESYWKLHCSLAPRFNVELADRGESDRHRQPMIIGNNDVSPSYR